MCLWERFIIFSMAYRVAQKVSLYILVLFVVVWANCTSVANFLQCMCQKLWQLTLIAIIIPLTFLAHPVLQMSIDY